MTTPLDEKALRKPDFAGGTPVALADGQAWTFADPVVTDYRFARDAGGRTVLRKSYAAAEYNALVDALIDAPSETESAARLFDMAFWLLSANYDLTVAQAAELIRLRGPLHEGFAENQAMWEAIRGVAFGTAPKPSPVG